jgi:hypothetical protein
VEHIFFDNWAVLIRTAVIGTLAYVSLITLLRLSGKRTLSKMNAFDFVVTVALGSTLATILLNKDVALAEGVLAFALLIGMQFAVTWSSVRARWVRRLTTGEPALLLYQGAFLPIALRWARVTEDEVRAAVRAGGLAGLMKWRPWCWRPMAHSAWSGEAREPGSRAFWGLSCQNHAAGRCPPQALNRSSMIIKRLGCDHFRLQFLRNPACFSSPQSRWDHMCQVAGSSHKRNRHKPDYRPTAPH